MAKMPASNSAKYNQHLRELTIRINELTEALKHERADAINLRRHYEEQLAGTREAAKVGIVSELLPVIDNFERAMQHIPKDLQHSEYVKGVNQIVRQFEKVLETLGVTKIESVGQSFDPRFHEAVLLEKGEGPEEVVSEEIQAGYCLGDKVIRHALVKVRSGQ
jgi:molecular chaperone GrpE